MSGDYQCTHCGSRYDYHPGRCRNCSENTVSYLPQPARRPPDSPAVASQASSAGSGLLGFVVVLIILGMLFG